MRIQRRDTPPEPTSERHRLLVYASTCLRNFLRITGISFGFDKDDAYPTTDIRRQENGNWPSSSVTIAFQKERFNSQDAASPEQSCPDETAKDRHADTPAIDR